MVDLLQKGKHNNLKHQIEQINQKHNKLVSTLSLLKIAYKILQQENCNQQEYIKNLEEMLNYNERHTKGLLADTDPKNVSIEL